MNVDMTDINDISRPPSGNNNDSGASLIDRKVNISVAYMEIYNENVHDLLSD